MWEVAGREDVLGERANVLGLLVALADVVVVECFAAPPQPRLHTMLSLTHPLTHSHPLTLTHTPSLSLSRAPPKPRRHTMHTLAHMPASVRCLHVPLSSDMAHTRQSRPDSGLGFHMKDLKTLEVVPSSLGSGLQRHSVMRPWAS